MDIFENKLLYPGELTPIKAHYQDNFEEVFIALIPFFHIDQGSAESASLQRTHKITFEEFKKKNPDLNISGSQAEFYSTENSDYPSDKEILKYATPVSWSEVMSGANFASYAEINQALRTTIGGYKAVFAREDLAEQLLDFAKQRRIFLPDEGSFDVLSKRAILNAFRALGKTSLIVEDEFYEKKKELDIADISLEKFCESIESKDYYIYDQNKETLFAIGWDFCFYFICSSRTNLRTAFGRPEFEGFYCEETTQLPWEHSAEEIRAALAEDERAAENRAKSERGGSPWWKFW